MISNKELIRKTTEAIGKLDPALDDTAKSFMTARTVLDTSFAEGYRTIKILDVMDMLNWLEQNITDKEKGAEDANLAPENIIRDAINKS